MADWVQVALPWQSYKNNATCRPGTLIEVRRADNGEVRQYLIGDINVVGGLCDDCSAFRDDDVVTQYKILIEV